MSEKFENVVEQFKKSFQNNCFDYEQDENLRRRIIEEKVPDRAGVYIISSADEKNEIFYIGKAGAMKSDGTFAGQKLKGRIANKQGGISRRKFFNEHMKEHMIRKEVSR